MSSDTHSSRRRATPLWVLLGIGLGSLLWFALATAIANLFVSEAQAADCAGATRHPIEARVPDFDPVRHGNNVWPRSTVTTGVAVRGLEARLFTLGGVTAVSADRVSLGRHADNVR